MLAFEFIEVAHNSSEYAQCIELRNVILRKPLGLVFSKEELLAEYNQIHLAAFKESKVEACLSLVPKDSSEIKMRQVAVAESAQGKGLGSALVRFSESFAKQKGFSKITLHAREVSIPFYKKIGYSEVGIPFMEVGLHHIKMTKVL